MRNEYSATNPKRRTAAQAIAQADAKFRISCAISIRGTGVAMIVAGTMMLSRPSAWGRGHQAVRIHFGNVGPFVVSLAAIIGTCALILGPLIAAFGHWRVRRAIDAARADPVTASVLDQPASSDFD